MIRSSLFVIICCFLFAACASKQKLVIDNQSSTSMAYVVEEQDTEYGVEMFDAKFEAWYKKYTDNLSGKEQSYYEEWNQKYVPVWNEKARSSSKNFPFAPVVGYNPNEDYGFELNHKLFHYFVYVEQVLKIEIIPEEPNFVFL